MCRKFSLTGFADKFCIYLTYQNFRVFDPAGATKRFGVVTFDSVNRFGKITVPAARRPMIPFERIEQ
jgi:hypothetical protein